MLTLPLTYKVGGHQVGCHQHMWTRLMAEVQMKLMAERLVVRLQRLGLSVQHGT